MAFNKNKLITKSNFKDFDWNKAKLFYHIAKCGGLAKAASIAGVDQPSLTRQIQVLEKQVGCPLLIRKVGAGGGVTLTRKGEELLNHIAPFFMVMRGFCSNNHSLDNNGKRKIRIATTHAIAAYIINDLLIDFNNIYPNITFEIITDDHVVDIILSDADILIRPYDKEAKNVIQEPLFSLQKKLYASKEYLEKYGEPKNVNDLRNHRLVTSSSNPIDYPFADIHWILKLGMPEGESNTASFLSGSLECLMAVAKKGNGIIGGYEEMSILRNANLINILPDVKDNILIEYFIYPEYLRDDKEVTNIKDYLKSKLKIENTN